MPIRQTIRGTTAVFEELFIEDDGTPIPPADPNSPRATIKDPNGVTLSAGGGVSLGDGRFRFTWFVPVDAEVSSADSAYRVEWLFESATNRTIEKSLDFEVSDSVDVTPQERGYTYITLQNESERLFIRFRQPQETLTCTVSAPDNSKYQVDLNDITRVDDRGSIVYYIDTPALTKTGVYHVIWRARQTQISPNTTSIQQLRVPECLFWEMAPSLRMLLDKAQKRIGLVQAYSDSDMYEYLLRGIDIVNSTNPVTSWNFNAFPVMFGMPSYLLLAAGQWGLRAQYLAEGELNSFSFSGQTTTLDVDRQGVYESMLQNITDYLRENLQPTKRNMLRRVSPGSLAVRPYDFGLGSFVMPVMTANAGSQQLLPLLSRIGIM